MCVKLINDALVMNITSKPLKYFPMPIAESEINGKANVISILFLHIYH